MIHLLSDLPTWLATLTHGTFVPGSDLAQTPYEHLHSLLDHSLTLAQQFKEPDITGDVSKAWNHFVKTGQVWAFVIGVVSGYMVKTFTSYG